MEYLLHFPS